MVHPQMRVGLLTVTTWLLLAAPAFAGDNGEGLVGETDDKIITFFCLGLVLFFGVLVTLLTLLQNSLDKRKEQRKAVELRKRVGW
jgi:hypothetical protein